jgi:hypothetical protein
MGNPIFLRAGLNDQKPLTLLEFVVLLYIKLVEKEFATQLGYILQNPGHCCVQYQKIDMPLDHGAPKFLSFTCDFIQA